MLNVIIFIQGMTILVLCVYILSIRYRHGGQIVISKDEDGKKLFSLELDKDPDEIEKMRYISFKVTDSHE